MVEDSDRYRVGDHPRDGFDREWELFVREARDEPLRHVGSVSASSSQVAYEEASQLFGRVASDIWLCPAAEIDRYSTHRLDDDAEPAPVGTGADGA